MGMIQAEFSEVSFPGSTRDSRVVFGALAEKPGREQRHGHRWRNLECVSKDPDFSSPQPREATAFYEVDQDGGADDGVQALAE